MQQEKEMTDELIVKQSADFPAKTSAGWDRVGQHNQRNNPAIYGV